MNDVASTAPTWYERGSIIRPRSPAFCLFAFLMAIAAIGTFGALGTYRGSGTGDLILSRISAAQHASLLAITLMIVWAIPFVLVIHALDFFEREPYPMLGAAFLWGGIGAIYLSFPAERAIDDLLAKLGSHHLASHWSAAISAPVTEETFKALGLVLLVLIATAEIDTPIDGLVYGAFVGLGFQIVENFLYNTGDGTLQGVWDSFLLRGLVTGLWSHAAYTGLVGLGIGYFVSRTDVPRERRLQLAVLAFVGAWLLHFTWNAPWLTESVFQWRGWWGKIAFSLIKGLPGFLLLAGMYLHARRRESRWVEHVLAPEVAAGVVTPAELEALLTFQGRVAVRKAAMQSSGWQGARRAKELQREQVALAVDLTKSRGASTPEIERHRATIASIRAILQKLPAKSPPAAPAKPSG